MKKAFIAGTFDGFHVGHQFLLWTAYAKVEAMVVVVAQDVTVKRTKGRYPRRTGQERLARLATEFKNTPSVSVRMGRETGDFLQTVREESPTHLFLGYDQKADIDRIKEAFPDLIIKRMPAYFESFFKSSKFVQGDL